MEKLVALYDTQRNVYTNYAVVDERLIDSFFTEMANSVDSPCYNLQQYFKTAIFNTGEEIEGIEHGIGKMRLMGYFELESDLLSYVNQKRIEQQNMIQALNYLPTGYFKMPAEMQNDIREKIDEAVKSYAQYLVDNADIKKEDIKNDSLEKSADDD